MHGKITVKRIATYLLGLLILAVGVNVSKMAGLGISPVSSIPRALEVVCGYSLGQMVIVVYFVLTLLQMPILRKKFSLVNFLGIPVGLVNGYLVDLVGIDPNAFGHLLYGFPRPQTYMMQLVYLIVSIIIVAIGVYIYLKPELIPVPSDSLARAISVETGRNFGDCKSFVDTALVVIAAGIMLVFGGGIRSFTGDTVVVREGTILFSLCVGQVVKFIRRLLDKPKTT